MQSEKIVSFEFRLSLVSQVYIKSDLVIILMGIRHTQGLHLNDVQINPINYRQNG
jgi:hypothetical protein